MNNKELLDSDVVRQHTVPKFMLNNFAIDPSKKERARQVYALDIKTLRTIKMNLKDATVQNRFYNLYDQPKVVSLESLLCLYEGSGATVIRKLISTKDIQGLSEEEKSTLARFVTVQLLRTCGEYEKLKDLGQVFYNETKSRGFISEELDNYFNDENFDQNTKGNFLNRIANCDFEMSVILEKEWVLFETTPDRPFYISDNPVTMYNDNKFSDRSNTGLALPGIQIYIPLSATLTLAMVCSSLNDNLEKERNFIFKCISNNTVVEGPNFFERLEFIKNILDIRLVNIEEWRLKLLNDLQVWRAEHFIFSSLDNFEQTKVLISSCPELTRGPRMTIL